ncbi:ATP-binding protein [Streptomyces sp. NPDC056716]|uniref:ATP-binding protein n=1 Tax=unclassified Streptomyces TaxID=2593676 RepID=UPI0036749E06
MIYIIDNHPSPDSPRLGAMTLHPIPESVPRARRWFRKFSELATDAIVHGRSDDPWHVRVAWYREGDSRRVEVHPGYPANVQLRRPDANDAHGRALLLVDAIADSWHSGPSHFGGTVVSFTMADAWPT